MISATDRDRIVKLLSGSLQCPLWCAADAAYDEARQVWNAAIDRRPLAIAMCRNEQDIQSVLAIARDNAVPVTVRGGGHNVAGLSMRDGAILLDLSALREVAVDGKMRVATVGGGALWRHVDSATASHSLAVTGGVVSSTGIGGLTLGGGVGWLMRRHGLASDNLLSARVVLADGRAIRVSAEEHPDLYWLMRGGAARFGAVTEFQFRLHPLRDVLAGLVIHPAESAREVLRLFRDFSAVAPDEYCGLAIITHAPPLPFLDQAWHGRPVVILAACWCGEIAEGDRALAPLRQFGQPLADVIHPFAYAQWQTMQDPLAPAGRHHYWKSLSFKSLPDNVIDQLADAAYHLPSPVTELHVQHLGGAVARVPDGDSAFPHRHADFFVNLIGNTVDKPAFEAMRGWVRGMHARLAPHALPGMLSNFCGADDAETLAQFGTIRTQRIMELRRSADPNGLFAT
jgi:FAD/FMN-containing dehydrogenase